ncbi:nucleoside deaminase [Dactylosporangium sp. CA-092794]|uniref:nucleoside deaminase n=1 Tax=Dactylosporangium sp. CA-092794 TaxID=3239929 RepID=UPI003D8F28D7
MLAVDQGQLMSQALDMAREALAAGDHPYGSVVVTASGTVAERNRVNSASDPTAHSEVMAVRTAAAAWGIGSLRGSLLLTTFEPCPMCLGAIAEAGVGTLVIGARRTVGEAPLGDYTVEALLGLMGRGGDIAITEGVLAEPIALFYAAAG